MNTVGKTRPVKAMKLSAKIKPAIVPGGVPQLVLIEPSKLLVEESYQRTLSAKSERLIQKIVGGFDWTKFKPPVVARAGSGYFIIDGQHTAIAAATHGGIKQIPVLVVAADQVEKRASAFVSHNRDRLAMTQAEIFYAECAAGDKVAHGIMDALVKVGASIPRSAVAKADYKPGQISALGELRVAYATMETAEFERLLRIAVMSKLAPLNKTILNGLRILLTGSEFDDASKSSDRAIAAALSSITALEEAATCEGFETGAGRAFGCASIIAKAIE